LYGSFPIFGASDVGGGGDAKVVGASSGIDNWRSTFLKNILFVPDVCAK
jgi:hypothetical protein